MTKEIISYIIPAYNEEKNISSTIEKIKKYSPVGHGYEIIVVDHGSTDSTKICAKENGAKVYIKKDTTIAGLRNYGVSNSSGGVLIFLDADIHLTQQWQENINDILRKIRAGDRLLTGSWYCVPDNPNWIEKFWFEPLQKIINTHINSGHLIIGRQLFDELNGFDENLETGEDYDISMRAKAKGIDVEDNHDLKVIHHGYPKSLYKFMQREYWHGKGDATSLSAIAKSKVAILSIVFMLLHILLIVSIILTKNLLIPVVAIIGVAAICFMSSFVKFRREHVNVIFMSSLLYYFYFLSRSASLLNGIFRKEMKKRQR